MVGGLLGQWQEMATRVTVTMSLGAGVTHQSGQHTERNKSEHGKGK